MSAYRPGTVADATVRGESTYRVMRILSAGGPIWVHSETLDGSTGTRDSDVTNIRPLIVLDLDSANDTISRSEVAKAAIKTLRKSPYLSDSRLAEQIRAQVQPLTPEPGWGAIVEAGVEQHDERLLWTPNDQGFWACKNPDEYARHWPELIDPILVRPGVEDES